MTEKGERRQVILFILSLAVIAGLVIINFTFLYRGAKENMISSQEKKVIQSSAQVESSLTGGISTVRMAAYALDNMQEELDINAKPLKRRSWSGSRNAGILKYLTQQTEIYKGTIDSDFTGVYGVFGGEYLDGSGWVPDEGYDPKERPWYQTIKDAAGKTVLVTPYLDADTGSMMMTVGQLLSNGADMVALDIRVDGLQKIMKELVEADPENMVFVMDENGFVIAHSEETEPGKEYLEESGTLGHAVATKLLASGKQNFEVKHEGKPYLVFDEMIQDEWYVVTVMDENRLLSPLKKIYLILAIVLVLVVVTIRYIFASINKRHQETRDLNVQLKSLAGIYDSMHFIDLERDTLTEVRSSDEIKGMVGEGNDHAQYGLQNMMGMKTDKQHKKAVLTFIDLSTLVKRLSDKDTIAMEYLNEKNEWYRGRFIVVDRDKEGNVIRVMWMVERIDEERRERDKLLYLSETDRMTGINNRGSGEMKIREMLAGKRAGMFCLMDADHFKSINDTYGHGVGDKVIIAIADCLRKTFRENDVIMRLGGDEFAAYAPTVMNEESGRLIVNRFFENISNTRIPEMGDRQILVSMGVAFYQYNDTFSFEELYKRADSCTYESKKTEGNKATYYQAGQEDIPEG